MSTKEKGSPSAIPVPGGQEGRTFDREGRDLGDTSYHHQAFELETNEATILSTLIDSLITQQESEAETNPSKTKAIYEHLVHRYPKHPRVTIWQEKVKAD